MFKWIFNNIINDIDNKALIYYTNILNLVILIWKKHYLLVMIITIHF